MAMSGLSLWDCDKHGELFLASFHLPQSLDLYYVGDRQVGQHRLIKKKVEAEELRITEI